MNKPLQFSVKDIDGNVKKLSDYIGKTVLVVNVASKCGLTPQYKGLQALYEKYQSKNFVILGFPSNDFMGQEPGTESEIKQFCDMNYKVSFPLFSKIKVKKGDGQSELYQYLTSKESNPGFDGEIEWNFQKFLVNSEGTVIKRFSPKTSPEEIDSELAKIIGA
jgi:glutathione peroxidase